MCRNIRTLSNFEPPASPEEIRAAALQFVRKVSGCTRPSQANLAVFEQAVSEVDAVVARLLEQLKVNGPVRDREVEAVKAKARSLKRFGPRA